MNGFENCVVLHVGNGVRRIVDRDDVFFFEAKGGDTFVRFRKSKRALDVRELGQIERATKDRGFVRVHDHYVVNAHHIAEIRRKSRTLLEVKMKSPVNRLLPVSRRKAKTLLAIFGEA